MAINKYNGCFALSLLAVALNQAVYAAEQAEAELPVVTVTVGRGSSLQEMDISTTVISREQVQSAPETSVDQIVNKIPGIFTLTRPGDQLHPTSEVFSIRGFGTTTNVNTLVLVDGIPTNDPYFRTIDWAQIPKDSIERIEVIRGGGATSLWGNLAMGGIVNIVTREPAPNEKRINASYGSFNTVTADGAATLLSSDQSKIGINIGGINTDGYNATPEQYRNPVMVPTASHSVNMTLSSYYTPSQDSKYYLKVFGHRTQEHGQVWDDTSNTWDNFRVSGGGSTKLSGGSSVNMAGWVGRGEMDTTNAGTNPTFNILTPGMSVTPFVSQIEQAKYNSLGGSLFYQNDLGSIKDYKIGLDIRGITANDNMLFISSTGTTASILARGEHRFEGIFAQGTYRPQEIPLDITLGLREDFFQTNAGSINGSFFDGSALANNLDNQSYSNFDPRLGAKYYFANGMDVRAAIYRNFAAPGMNQMYRSTFGGSTLLNANPTLKPQTNVGQEIGVDYVRPGLDVAFTLFSNNLSGFIDYAPLCTTVADCDPIITPLGLTAGSVTRVNQYVNAGDAVLKGAELLANWRASESVQLNGGITRTIAYLTSSAYTATPSTAAPADPINAQLGQVPGWMATLGSTWQATDRLELVIQIKSFPDYWNNTAHSQLNDGATLADVGATYRFSKTADIYGLVQNIGNKSYNDQGLTYTTMNGTTPSTSAIPSLGLPLSMRVGVRASF